MRVLDEMATELAAQSGGDPRQFSLVWARQHSVADANWRARLDRRFALRAAIRERFPDGRAPRGAWSDLAGEFKYSVASVAKIAKALGCKIVAGLPSSRPRQSRQSEQTKAIIAAIQSRYPCGTAPRGAWKALAAEYGISSERVRQIATLAGSHIGRIEAGPKAVCTCGQPLKGRGSRLCADCLRVTIPCAKCGTEITLLASAVVSRLRQSHRKGAGHDAPGLFCSRRCRNAWWGASANSGRLHDPEALRQIQEAGRAKRAARTTCKRGHPWVPANLYVWTDRHGHSRHWCRECVKGRQQAAAVRRAG